MSEHNANYDNTKTEPGEFREVINRMQSRANNLENLSIEILEKLQKFIPELPSEKVAEEAIVRPDGIVPEIHRIIDEEGVSIDRLKRARELLNQLV